MMIAISPFRNTLLILASLSLAAITGTGDDNEFVNDHPFQPTVGTRTDADLFQFWAAYGHVSSSGDYTEAVGTALSEETQKHVPHWVETCEPYEKDGRSYFDCRFEDIQPNNPDGEEETPLPTTEQIFYTAVATARISGAGLMVQPSRQGVVGIPQLAHASVTTQTHYLSLLGHEIRADFWATEYSFDFGDGSAPIISKEPGAPYPDMTIQHTYRTPQPNTVVTLKTTWAAAVTNPFTGERMEVDGVLTTTEQSEPFNVRRAYIHLTDTAEEMAGH